ncbi:unnamed protein product [Caenorhabditis angaria]|uniref:Uncharacterized protein n=1 Tax=Caenorhabditis angaria TaxID=860376 RepID=A0A9P1MZW9_9PELO|nr:unnamed protein product [Caenorhabditis angaria]
MKIWDYSRSMIVLLVLSTVVSSFRHHFHRKRSMLEADPCLDEEDIENPSEISFPKRFEHLKRPWIADDNKYSPKVFKGEGINYQWAWMKSLVVKGLSKSIEDILQFLYKKDCLFIPVGPMIRDLILRNQPVFLSGEVSCDIQRLYNDCKKKFGAQVCALYPVENGSPEEYRLEIGDWNVNSTIDQMRAEPVSIYGWRTILGKSQTQWSYTVDIMAIYDDIAGTTYLIDPTGRGYRDVCEKKLVATVDDNQWNDWAKNQPIKVLSFYDLRTSGFSVANSQFQTFVNEKIKDVNYKDSQKFYCEHILKGVVNTSGNPSVCHTLYPQKEQSRRIETMRNIMIKETGTIWNDTVGSGGDRLEAIFETSQQFVSNREIIKKREKNDAVISETEPTIIIKGKPMIKDMSEVHTRPIYPMSEEPVKLPVEFPSLPNAKPNEKLEFHEPETQGAGYNDPIAYEVSREDENGASGDKSEPEVITTQKPTESPVILPTDTNSEDLTITSYASQNQNNIIDFEEHRFPDNYSFNNFHIFLIDCPRLPLFSLVL